VDAAGSIVVAKACHSVTMASMFSMMKRDNVIDAL
jgi:hypothetical protein